MSDDFQARLDGIAAMGELASFEPDVDLEATAVFRTSSGAPQSPQGQTVPSSRAAPGESRASRSTAPSAKRGRFAAKPTAAGWALRVFRIAPILIVSGLVLAAFPRVDALWFQTLTAGETVGTGAFGCQPYTVALKSAVTVGTDTTYTYTFSGGGLAGPECKNDISYVALPVCFDAALVSAGDVLSETHPAATTNPASHWAYSPQGKNSPYGSRVKWDATGVGHGPFNALEFSFTLAGTAIPTETVTAQYHAGDGNQPDAAGTVLVPHPTSCDASKVKTAPVAPLGNSSIATTDSAPPSDAAAPPQVQTPTPAPTSTPTATPTPKTVNKPGTFIGILQFPSTPTPAPAGEK